MRQIILGEDSWTSLIDRMVARTCAAARGLDPSACRELIELILISRLRATERCGRHVACIPDDREAIEGACAGWDDPDVEALPHMFAAAAADRIAPAREARAALEARLAHELRAELDAVIVENPRCGHAAGCGGAPVFPIRRA